MRNVSKASKKKQFQINIEKTSFDENKNYEVLTTQKLRREKKTLIKRQYFIIKMRIDKTKKFLRDNEFFIFIFEFLSKRKSREIFSKNNTIQNDERSFLKRARFNVKKIMNFDSCHDKNIKK